STSPPRRRATGAMAPAPRATRAARGSSRGARPASLDRDELLLAQRRREPLVRLGHLVPAGQRAHRAHPAVHVRETLEAHADEIARREDPGAEVVGDRNLVAAQILLAAENALVEHLEPHLGLVAAPLDRRALRLLGRADVVREDLRVDEVV